MVSPAAPFTARPFYVRLTLSLLSSLFFGPEAKGKRVFKLISGVTLGKLKREPCMQYIISGKATLSRRDLHGRSSLYMDAFKGITPVRVKGKKEIELYLSLSARRFTTEILSRLCIQGRLSFFQMDEMHFSTTTTRFPRR